MNHLTALILQGGAVAGALTVIVGALVALVRFAVLRPLTAVIDERVDGLRRQVDDRLDLIEHQLHPNGGGSMRDAVRRIEVKVDTVAAAVVTSDARTSTYIRAQATALRRLGLDAPDPSDFGIN